MIITDILNILKADTALKTLLGATTNDTRIYPYSTSQTDNCIVYIVSPVSDEDAKRVDRLEIRAISTDLGNAYAIDSRVRTLLKTIGDTPNNNFLNVVINGGGSLEDAKTGMYQFITYYYIISKGVY